MGLCCQKLHLHWCQRMSLHLILLPLRCLLSRMIPSLTLWKTCPWSQLHHTNPFGIQFRAHLPFQQSKSGLGTITWSRLVRALLGWGDSDSQCNSWSQGGVWNNAVLYQVGKKELCKLSTTPARVVSIRCWRSGELSMISWVRVTCGWYIDTILSQQLPDESIFMTSSTGTDWSPTTLWDAPIVESST